MQSLLGKQQTPHALGAEAKPNRESSDDLQYKEEASSGGDVGPLACMPLTSLHQCSPYLCQHTLQRHACRLQTQKHNLSHSEAHSVENAYALAKAQSTASQQDHCTAKTTLGPQYGRLLEMAMAAAAVD